MTPIATEADLHRLVDERPLAPVQLLVLAVCFLLQTIDGFDVLAMAFAAPALAEDWQLSADRLGIVFSAGVRVRCRGDVLSCRTVESKWH